MPNIQLSGLSNLGGGLDDAGGGFGLSAGASLGAASLAGLEPLFGLKNLSKPLGCCSHNAFHCCRTS